jgi:hypothetical protein
MTILGSGRSQLIARSRRTTITPIEKSVLVRQFGLMMIANKDLAIEDPVSKRQRKEDLVKDHVSKDLAKDTTKKTEDLKTEDLRTDARSK